MTSNDSSCRLCSARTRGRHAGASPGIPHRGRRPVALQDSRRAIREVTGNGGAVLGPHRVRHWRNESHRRTAIRPAPPLPCNFAWPKAEAHAPPKDPTAPRPGTGLAEFLCRIQIRLDAYPDDGAWYRIRLPPLGLSTAVTTGNKLHRDRLRRRSLARWPWCQRRTLRLGPCAAGRTHRL